MEGSRRNYKNGHATVPDSVIIEVEWNFVEDYEALPHIKERESVCVYVYERVNKWKR